MDFALSEDQLAIGTVTEAVCADIGDEYWREKDKLGRFPEDFYSAMAAAGWLDIAMPSDYGSAGLGIVDPVLIMETVSGSGAGLSDATAIHMNVFDCSR